MYHGGYLIRTGEPETMQNVTIEERVALLEIQVADVEVDISILFENDNFLFDETVIQDERLFSLEQETEEIEDDIVSEFLKGDLTTSLGEN